MAGYRVTNEDYSKWNTRTTTLSNEDIYVNLQINNPPEALNPVPAFYSEYRNQPLLEDATNYKMAITNIYAPGTNIPLFKFVENLSNGQFRYAVTLRMVQDVGGAAPPVTMANGSTAGVSYIPFKINDYDTGTNDFVYNFNQLVLMVNDAFNRAYIALRLAYNAAPGKNWDNEVAAGTLPNVAPKIVFNPETQLFSIVAPFLYNPDMTNPNPLNPTGGIPFIAISMNWNAYNWFQNLPAIAQDYRYESNGAGNPYDNVTLRIYNTGRPNALIPVQFYTPPYTAAKPASFPGPAGNTWAYPTLGGPDTAYVYSIEQQDQSLENISTVRSIVVRSSMPVRAEYINATNNSTSVGLVNILADFAVSLTQGSPILYTPSPVFRYIDCLADYFNQLGYQLWWADQNGDEYPIMVSPGETVELKMVFTRK